MLQVDWSKQKSSQWLRLQLPLLPCAPTLEARTAQRYYPAKLKEERKRENVNQNRLTGPDHRS